MGDNVEAFEAGSLARPTPLEEAVLHIGLGKTGTTSVQSFLYSNRDRLAEHGMLMPDTPGRSRHVGLGFFMKSPATVAGLIDWQRLGEESLEEWRKRFRRQLRRELVRAQLPRAFFTDEDLFSCRAPAIGRLRRLTDRLARRTRVVVYLRRQDDHLVSRYQQAVKVGETARLSDFAARKWAWKYDYAMQLDRWRRVLEPTTFVVRRYEVDRFAGGSLYQDFLDAIGVEASAGDFEPIERPLNDALPVEAAEFIRLLNIYRVEEEGASGYTIENRALAAGLREMVVGGPTLTLPESDLDRFMGRWQESNRRVAQQFLGDDTLFRTPRKTRNTTTEQWFDPARLDHYVDALGIRVENPAALRAIAAREAARARPRRLRRWMPRRRATAAR